jgi:uncharacterized protein YndB with AHSA1/START domain
MSDRARVARRLVMQDFTTTLTLDATPDQVFAAIANVRGWWSEEIDGPTDHLGARFEFHFEDHHRSTHEIVEYAPGQRIVWNTVDAQINFVADKTEWNGTRVVFDIEPRGAQTALRFTHVGLAPAIECYGKCSRAWAFHLGSLRDLIQTGTGQPNRAAR